MTNKYPYHLKFVQILSALIKKVNRKGKSTTFYSKHVPNSVGAKLVCIDDKFTQPTKIFFGSKCINEFLQWVFRTKPLCNKIIKTHFNKELLMTEEDEEIYNNTNICWICSKEITENKVRDHCHITGKYRGAAHKDCNLKLRIPKKLPVIFHILEGYDGHFIIRDLKNFTNITIKVIPKSTEKYMSIIINKSIIFLESLQFLKGSLDGLAANLEDTDRKHLLSEFSDTHLQLLKKKDPYPYEWVDDYRKFNYPRLPPDDAFYLKLDSNQRGKSKGYITKEERTHLNNIWQTFDFNKFKDFHIYYLKKDVLLLADVFEKFI